MRNAHHSIFAAMGKTVLAAMFAFLLFSLIKCGLNATAWRLAAENGKKFEKLSFTKVWQKDFLGRWCLACPSGVVVNELTDRTGREYLFSLYDYQGNKKKEKLMAQGQGPSEIQVLSLDTVWLSSNGKIKCIDNGYLKSIDPETLEIETIAKLSNVIKDYGSRYTFGRITSSPIEERDNRIVTSFESSGFPEDFRYYLVSSTGVFDNLSVIATETKEKPLSWAKLEESKKKGRLESYIDYYGRLREFRIFSVDWNRDVVYLIPNIEKPEFESIDLKNRQKVKYLIDMDFDKFKVEREEFDFYYEYASSETPEILKPRIKSILYIPPHAPPLMGVMVKNDWLLLITGNRNWKKGENEVLVYHLPSLQYEGSFFLPFSNIHQRIKWYDPYYVTANTIGKNDDYWSHFEIYRFSEKGN